MIARVPLLIVAGCCALLCSQSPEPTPAAKPEPGLYATFETSLGSIKVRLFEEEAPATVKNFVDLARGTKEWQDPETGEKVKRPLYAGTIFHRVISGFMIQGGDPSGTGIGDTGFVIPDEISPALKFDLPGRLAMANSGPNTGSTQFFITEVASPHLDGLHTIFGQVVEGLEVVARIAQVPRDEEDRPKNPIKISTVAFERVDPEKTGGVEKPGPDEEN
jgi:peptidyl-prolyl cis-trans isomerase A (cyclophilin A)